MAASFIDAPDCSVSSDVDSADALCIDECHFLVCHLPVVASVVAPSARVITAKPFQFMMDLKCPTAARPVLDVARVDGLVSRGRKEAVPRMSGRIHYRLTRSHQHIADVIGPLL